MSANLLIVQLCEFREDGDGIYRLHAPSRFLAQLPGVIVVDCHISHRLLPALLDVAHVVILPFVHNWDLLAVIEQRRKSGKVTVFEANDDYTDVQPWNPVAEMWRDKSIHVEFRQYMAQCDAVQTSTEPLANLWRPLSRRVSVFPNQLPALRALLPPPRRPLTIGWGGSAGHFGDWYAVAPLLQRWLEAHPDVHLAVMTNELAKPFFSLPSYRYSFTPPGSLSNYLDFLQSLDIGLAPLLPTPYNFGRSDVKFLEYAVSGVAGIYARLPPYERSVADGQTGLFYSTNEQLLEKLDQLVQDSALRHHIRAQAHQHVCETRQLQQHIKKRLDFYRELLPSKPVSQDLPAAVLAAAEVDGRYLRLRPGEPEQVYLSSQRMAAPAAAAALTDLTIRFPDYHAALVHQGRQLNNVKQYSDALIVLRRAQKMQPSSIGALCELGRTHYLRGENVEATECFKSALTKHPYYYPGWQYFLRFLLLTRSDEARQWGARAREFFPADLDLALAAAPLFAPEQRIRLLSEILDSPARPDPDDMSGIAALSQAIAETMDSCSANAEIVALLRRACETFAHSARLADLFGRLLYCLGEMAESAEHYRRALEIRRAARAYSAEFPREQGAFYLWQFAEHSQHYSGRIPEDP